MKSLNYRIPIYNEQNLLYYCILKYNFPYQKYKQSEFNKDADAMDHPY